MMRGAIVAAVNASTADIHAYSQMAKVFHGLMHNCHFCLGDTSASSADFRRQVRPPCSSGGLSVIGS